MTATSELTFKKVKVSDKGQISIPVDLQRKMGIKKGDELLLIRKGRKVVLEKPVEIMKTLGDELADVEAITETSLRRMWLKKEEDIWNRYVEGKSR